MESFYSIAIETSCRCGGVALGRGGELLKAVRFDASYRHATQLVARLEELLRGAGIRPRDLAEVYVSVGPGSFTGLRVGVTVARTLAEASTSLRLVAVPTIGAVAENARDLPWENLGVVLDFKDGEVYAGLFNRGETETPLPPAGVKPSGGGEGQTPLPPGEVPPSGGGEGTAPPHGARSAAGRIVPSGAPALERPEDFLARAPRPILLIGEALGLVKMEAGGVSHAPPELNLPTPEGVWRVGRRMAAAGAFTHRLQLLPLYTRKPEAVRLWEKRNPM